jgi:hypothetical protein
MCSSESCATGRETSPCGACAVQNGTDLVQADKHDFNNGFHTDLEDDLHPDATERASFVKEKSRS